MADESTVGLSPERLAKLLAVGAEDIPDAEGLPPVEVTAEILRARLSNPLPLDQAALDSVPAILRRPCEELRPLAGRPLAEILLDPAADPTVIATLKDYGKAMSLRWRGGALHGAAVAVYYGAIAAALVCHGRKITTHSYRGLDHSFATLIGKPWMAPELAELLARARAVCDARMTR